MIQKLTIAWPLLLTQQDLFGRFLYECLTWPTNPTGLFWQIFILRLNFTNSPNRIILADFRTHAWLGPLTQQHCYGGFSYQCLTWPTNPTTLFWWILVLMFNLANSPNNIVLVDFCTDIQLGKLTQQHHYGGFLYQRSTWPTNPTRSFWWVFVTKFDLAYSPSKVTLSDLANSS